MSIRRLAVVTAACALAAGSMVAAAAPGLHLVARSNPGRMAAAVNPAAPHASYLVLMVLDGARPDYFGLTTLPHVDALRRSGTQFTNAMAGILEAETPTGHATIATGSKPTGSGILGFDWVNDNDRRYSLFDPNKMTNLEQILQDSGAPTLAGLYKQKFPHAVVVALSGHKYYAAAPLGGPKADAILYFQGDPKGHYVPVAVPGHVPPAGVLNAPGVTTPTTRLPDGAEDRLATNLALAAVRVMHPRMLLINYPEFDWPLGHVDGGNLNKAKVITDMREFDADLARIEDMYRRAGILKQTLFVITADHGMMPITHFVPASVINNAIQKAGATAPDIATSSADYIWLTQPGKAPAVVANILAARDPGIQSVYYAVSAANHTRYVLAGPPNLQPNLKTANRFLLKSLLNGHQPTLVVVGREGASFSDPKTGWKADHGGPSFQSQHIPLILSGPGIRSGVVSQAPAQLDDLAPTVLADMGVEPIGMQGHVLSDALSQPAPAAVQHRSKEVKRITPISQALQQQG